MADSEQRLRYKSKNRVSGVCRRRQASVEEARCKVTRNRFGGVAM